MTSNAKPKRDAFTFSLGGITTIASFVNVQAVARDNVNKAIDKRLRQAEGDQ